MYCISKMWIPNSCSLFTLLQCWSGKAYCHKSYTQILYILKFTEKSFSKGITTAVVILSTDPVTNNYSSTQYRHTKSLTTPSSTRMIRVWCPAKQNGGCLWWPISTVVVVWCKLAFYLMSWITTELTDQLFYVHTLPIPSYVYQKVNTKYN